MVLFIPRARCVLRGEFPPQVRPDVRGGMQLTRTLHARRNNVFVSRRAAPTASVSSTAHIFDEVVGEPFQVRTGIVVLGDVGIVADDG